MSFKWILLIAALAFPAIALLSFDRHSNIGVSTNKAVMQDGKDLYLEHCASCHGVDLEGQPNWRRRKPDGRLPAPPHDAMGHTWHHPDALLFKITKRGTEAIVGGGYKSDMPGFGEVLSDDQIRAVLAYIKEQWPDNIRQRQEQLNTMQN